MGKRTRFSTVLLLALVLASAGASRVWGETDGSWGNLGTYGRRYDTATEETFTGRVATIIKIPYGCTPEQGEKCYCVALAVEDQQGKSRTVYLGPCSYMKKKGCSLAPGDTVTVTGSAVVIEGRPLVIARSTAQDGKVVGIRNSQGLHL